MGRRRIMIWLALIVAAYLGVVLLAYLMQDLLTFPGAVGGRDQPLPFVQGVQTSTLSLADGTPFRIAEGEPATPARGVLLFFVGNGENLRSGMGWAGELTNYGVATVVPEYPGYGESGGSPSVASLLAAAEVAADRAQHKATALGVPLLVGGSSLGTFCAMHLASRGRGERLLLLAPPTSTVDAGAARYPWLPVRLMLRHRFDNVGPAARVTVPALVIHGDADHVVPIEMGRRVAAALGGPVQFIAAEGHDHTKEPLAPYGPYAARIRAFLVGE